MTVGHSRQAMGVIDEYVIGNVALDERERQDPHERTIAAGQLAGATRRLGG